VTGEPCLPGKKDVVFDHCASGQPNLCHNKTSLPDPNIVRDLDKVVDLRTRTNHGITDAATIYRRVRADLDVIFKIAATHVSQRDKTTI
jgi:hypothetical protein